MDILRNIFFIIFVFFKFVQCNDRHLFFEISNCLNCYLVSSHFHQNVSVIMQLKFADFLKNIPIFSKKLNPHQLVGNEYHLIGWTIVSEWNNTDEKRSLRKSRKMCRSLHVIRIFLYSKKMCWRFQRKIFWHFKTTFTL